MYGRIYRSPEFKKKRKHAKSDKIKKKRENARSYIYIYDGVTKVLSYISFYVCMYVRARNDTQVTIMYAHRHMYIPEHGTSGQFLLVVA